LRYSLRLVVWAALLLISATLAAYSQIAPTAQELPESGPDPSYRDIIATYLKSSFKDYKSYEAFQIAAPRRVRSFHGLDWISCVRFWDAGHRRTYAVFINGKSVVDGRYANQTDQCGSQEYDSFGQMGGSLGLDPLH
jgi:hypothetical protein